MDEEVKGRLKSLLSKKFLLWLLVTGATVAGKVPWDLWIKLTMVYMGSNVLTKATKENGLLNKIFRKKD